MDSESGTRLNGRYQKITMRGMPTLDELKEKYMEYLLREQIITSPVGSVVI
jgi:hypothetical protein